MSRHEDAVAANAEAIATLSDAFQRHPAAFAGQIGPMARQYIERCQKLGREPDAQLLASVTPVIAALTGMQHEDAQPGRDVSDPQHAH